MDSPAGRHITPLARPVKHRLRSGVIIPSIPQILNELVQNCLDAGATQIGCWINLEKGNETMRVEDNGHGLDEDGLSIVGQASGESKLRSRHRHR